MGGEKQNKLTALADNYNFTIVPDWIYQCLQLNGNDAIIFALILSYQQKDGYYGGSFKYIEKRYGITEKTAKRILPKLEDRQYIIKQQGDSKTRNKYTINFDVVNPLIEKQQGQNDTRDNLTLGTKCPYPNDKMSLGVGTKCPPSNKYSNKLSNKNIYTADADVDLKKEDDTSHTKKEADTKVSTTQKKKKPLLSQEQENNFARFWEVYPKKDDIVPAKKAWKKINPDTNLTEQIVYGAKMYAKEKANTDKQYIKKANNWLKDEAWRNYTENEEAAGNSQPPNNEPCKKPYYQEPIATF